MTYNSHNSASQTSNKQARSKGYVSIPREFIDWILAKNHKLLAPFLLLVRKATHVEKKLPLTNGSELTLKPLQCATSNVSLAAKLGIGRRQLIALLRELETLRLVSVVRVTEKLSIYTLNEKFIGWVSPFPVSSSAVTSLCSEKEQGGVSKRNTTCFEKEHRSSTYVDSDGPPQDPLLYPLPRKDQDYLPEHIIDTLFKSGKVELGMGGAWVTKEFKEKIEGRYTKQQIDAAAESLWKWAMNTNLAKDGTPWYLIYRRQWQNHEKLMEKELKKMEH